MELLIKGLQEVRDNAAFLERIKQQV